MERRNRLVYLLRVVLAVPVVVVGTVVGLYLFWLGFSPLLRVKWFSDRTRRFSSRRSCVTPLSAYRLGDGFVLGVAYPQVDWCRNVLAADGTQSVEGK